MDQWGETLGKSELLSPADKGEIVAALFDGYNRQNQAMGYARAFGGMMRVLPEGLKSLVADVPFDLAQAIMKSPFSKIADQDITEFEAQYKRNLDEFECPVTGWKF